MNSVGARIQNLPLTDQVLALAKIAEGRSDARRFTPASIETLFDEVALPHPPKIHNPEYGIA